MGEKNLILFCQKIKSHMIEGQKGCCYYGCLGNIILAISILLCICLFPIALPAGLRNFLIKYHMSTF